jgi:hypothetical protein
VDDGEPQARSPFLGGEEDRYRGLQLRQFPRVTGRMVTSLLSFWFRMIHSVPQAWLPGRSSPGSPGLRGSARGPRDEDFSPGYSLRTSTRCVRAGINPVRVRSGRPSVHLLEDGGFGSEFRNW